jgi:hypothetical protein
MRELLGGQPSVARLVPLGTERTASPERSDPTAQRAGGARHHK